MQISDLLAARVPRYTSYPTAPHFNAAVTGVVFRRWLQALPTDEPLSLYFHVPFCETLCWYCGCHTRVVNTYSPVAAYLDVMLREVEQVAQALGARRRVTHIHFGGGSPTMLRPDDWSRVDGLVRSRFDVAHDAEIAVEIDPRGLSPATIDALVRAGVNRASVGVQDVNPHVQHAINRWQPVSLTADVVRRLRGSGIEALNIDLIYGLPRQSVDDVARTVDAAVALAPQRIALFGYAHVPEMKRHQQLIDATALPGPEERLRQYEHAHRQLVGCGYQPIGLDHFAVAGDALAQAQRAGRLRRNFQGYTTDEADALIGFGASAISSLPQGYAQNASAAPDYAGMIRAGGLAVARGRALTDDDRIRRAIIERLMCDLAVDIAALAATYGRHPSDFLPEIRSLAPLQAQGIVQVEGWRVRVPQEMRVAVRLVCAAFDAYLQPQTARHAIAV
ncbi:MAG: oxygen-independent coproporphyrinogen III oxidase [Alphaproteobacteria bacterium]|nr:oxygen-independent coproporphyrinogen III oxidase [Alphaproteobacteria bacterium]